MEIGLVLAMIGVFSAVALAGIGSAIGCTISGEASNGVMSEAPENFVNLLILSALPGTQGVYGFVIGFLVILKTGIMGGTLMSIDLWTGGALLVACLPVAFAGLISAIYQGKVCGTGAQMLAKQPKELVKPMMMAVLVEFYAILGFTASFLLLNGIKIGA